MDKELQEKGIRQAKDAVEECNRMLYYYKMITKKGVGFFGESIIRQHAKNSKESKEMTINAEEEKLDILTIKHTILILCVVQTKAIEEDNEDKFTEATNMINSLISIYKSYIEPQDKLINGLVAVHKKGGEVVTYEYSRKR